MSMQQQQQQGKYFLLPFFPLLPSFSVPSSFKLSPREGTSAKDIGRIHLDVQEQKRGTSHMEKSETSD
jgi:hypothetical protein